jgi:hypothetical protein
MPERCTGWDGMGMGNEDGEWGMRIRIGMGNRDGNRDGDRNRIGIGVAAVAAREMH